MTYDNKIDAMYEATVHCLPNSHVYWTWLDRQKIEDKRNKQRMEAYTLKRGVADSMLNAALESIVTYS